MSATDVTSPTDPTAPEPAGSRAPAVDLVERLSEATLGALELFAVYLGSRLHLYEVLDRRGPLDPGQLAEAADIDERYAREWLEQQAVAGYLAVVDDGTAPVGTPSAGEGTRRFALRPEHRGVLVDPLDGEHLAPFAPMAVGIAQVLDEVVEAYRTGGGVPYSHYGADFRHGQGSINRPAFTADLVKSWLPAVEGLPERLEAGARVADIGTGHGWSAIAVKAEWPSAEVVGLDADRASVDDAATHAAQAGVDVRFVLADDGSASDLAALAPIDVALIMEALHDMARPVEVLSSIREALAPGGIVVIADEAVAESFQAPGDEIERMMYGWSVVHCLPASMAESPSAALGTVLRPGTVAELAEAAGFGRCEVVDVDAGFFRLYRLAV